MAGSIQQRKSLVKDRTIFPTHGQSIDDFMLQDDPVLNKIMNLADKRAIEITPSNKYRLVLKPFALSQNWCYIKQATWIDCTLWHDIIFDELGFLPIPCMDCWKVVITTDPNPEKQTVLDLFKLRNYLNSTGLASKCGVDVRVYTPVRYAGFVYNRGFEEGLENWALVNDTIRDELPNAHVILKRSCTEYEHRFGRSDRWDLVSHCQKDRQQYILDMFEPTPEIDTERVRQTLQGYVLRFWIEYAHGIGDLTWKSALDYAGYDTAFEGGIFPSCLTYEHLIEKYRQGPEDNANQASPQPYTLGELGFDLTGISDSLMTMSHAVNDIFEVVKDEVVHEEGAS